MSCPKGFQRIRYYGFMGNRYREEKLERCRQLLKSSSPTPEQTEESGTGANAPPDYTRHSPAYLCTNARLSTRSHDHPCRDLSVKSPGTSTCPRLFMRSDYFSQSGSLQIGSPRSEKHCWLSCCPRGVRMRCPACKPRTTSAASFLVNVVSRITPRLTSLTTQTSREEKD